MKRLLMVLLLTACHGEPAVRPAPPDGASAPDAATTHDTALAVADARQSLDEGELVEEAPDRDPRSATVKLKLVVTPAAQGTVSWGRKRLADLRPGQMSMEVERPRSSGPLDLSIRADGFLPHHVRLFSDRDDKLVVRLYRPEEAQGLLGYRRASPAPSYGMPPSP